MQATLILLVIGAAILIAEAQPYYDPYDPYHPDPPHHPPSCGRCDFKDFKGKPGKPGPQVIFYVFLLSDNN